MFLFGQVCMVYTNKLILSSSALKEIYLNELQINDALFAILITAPPQGKSLRHWTLVEKEGFLLVYAKAIVTSSRGSTKSYNDEIEMNRYNFFA